jgi:hypothetical protein
MRTLSPLTILAMSLALAGGQTRAQAHGPGYYRSPLAYEGAPNSYCLQGKEWGYPGNCQFSSYAECMVTASGTHAYCGINPQKAFTLRRDYRPPY